MTKVKSARRQCAKCPWKVTTDPRTIPGEYSEAAHENLTRTIAIPGDLSPIFSKQMRVMACHEYAVGAELPCVGWLAHQLGPGNNLALRLAVFQGRISADFELDGEQHSSFEDTLPSKKADS